MINDLTYYIICGVLTAGIMLGIAWMSSVKTAVRGNRLSTVCVAFAVAVTLVKHEILTDMALIACMGISLAASVLWAVRVKMIEMPQVVAVLNGFGGAASAFVGAATLLEGAEIDRFSAAAAALAIAVGMVILI